MAVKTIRVEGLRDSARPPAERACARGAERQPLDLTVDTVLDLARAGHRPGRLRCRWTSQSVCELLLAEVEADENVWKAHKLIFRGHCVKAAANRLLIEHYWSENPDSLEVAIDRPINVIALPRSGSTHLENLLAADRRLRHLPVYLAAQPAPRPDEGPGPDGVDPRWTRAKRALAAVERERRSSPSCTSSRRIMRAVRTSFRFPTSPAISGNGWRTSRTSGTTT